MRRMQDACSGSVPTFTPNSSRRLRAADQDGLDPSSYPADRLAALMESAAAAGLRGQSIVELHFSTAFLEYASDIRVGRFLPRKLDPNFFVQERVIDQRAALQALAAAPSVEEFLVQWQPKAPELRRLAPDARRLSKNRGYGRLAVSASWREYEAGDRRPTRAGAPSPARRYRQCRPPSDCGRRKPIR